MRYTGPDPEVQYADLKRDMPADLPTPTSTLDYGLGYGLAFSDGVSVWRIDPAHYDDVESDDVYLVLYGDEGMGTQTFPVDAAGRTSVYEVVREQLAAEAS